MQSRRQVLLIAAVLAVALVVPVIAAIATKTNSTKTPKPTPTTTIPIYGDGRASEAHEFRLTNLRLPTRARVRGAVSVEILDAAARPVSTVVRERGTLMHLYIVRGDLGVFRHVRPRLVDGTWSAPITLPAGGDYRAIAEFTVKVDDHYDHVFLAGDGSVPGSAAGSPRIWAQNDVVAVGIEDASQASASGVITMRVTSPTGDRVKLRRHLGAMANVTAFHLPTGTIASLRPLGIPAADGDATVLHLDATGMRHPGPYVFFIRLRADDRLHTLRVVEQVG